MRADNVHPRPREFDARATLRRLITHWSAGEQPRDLAA